MNHVDSSPCPDGLDSDSHSLQLPLSDVRKPAACENCLFDFVAGQCANKIAFGDLARVPGKFLQQLDCEMLSFIRNSMFLQRLQGK